MTQIKVVDGQTSDGNSKEFYCANSQTMNIYLVGDLGGGTLSLQAKTLDGDWVSQQLSGNEWEVVESSSFIGRFNLTGSSSPNISVYVEGRQVYGG